jgi:hypothetical protein
MDFKRREDLEQIGAEIESGRRIHFLELCELLQRAQPTKSFEEIHREAFEMSPTIN